MVSGGFRGFLVGFRCTESQRLLSDEREAVVEEEKEEEEEEEEEEGVNMAARAAEVRLPGEIEWENLDKPRFFLIGTALFSGVSVALYPVVLLKTRLQISQSRASSLRTIAAILRHEGPRGFFRGLSTSLAGTVPARAIYMMMLEVTKSSATSVAARLGLPETAAATVANAVAGFSAAMAAQIVWTPIDVVSQRLMVQGSDLGGAAAARYRGGIDAFRKILAADGLRGLYRGFGLSLLTYAPTNAVWWGSYSLTHRTMWNRFRSKGGGDDGRADLACGTTTDDSDRGGNAVRPDFKLAVFAQAAGGTVAGGMSALVTMPMDTIKTRMQVLDGEEGGGGRRTPMTVLRAARSLIREGGLAACYRGFGPRWVSMSMQGTAMIATYDVVKRLSAKPGTRGGST